jgi:hypothetical protein
MTKKLDSPNSRKCQGDEPGHKNQIITDNYNSDALLLNILSGTSDNFLVSLLPTNFDSGMRGSELSELLGYDDCRACYFRVSSRCFPASLTQTNLESMLDEPDLSKMIGYDDCKTCYFRMSTIERTTQDVEKLRGGRI